MSYTPLEDQEAEGQFPACPDYRQPRWDSADASFANEYRRPYWDEADAGWRCEQPSIQLLDEAADASWMAGPEPEQQDRTGTLAASFPPAPPALGLNAHLAQGQDATLAATMPPVLAPLGLSGSIQRDLALPDIDGVRTSTRHQNATRFAKRIRTAQQQAFIFAARANAHHQNARHLQQALWLAHAESDKLSVKDRLPHAQGIPLEASTRARHQDSIRLRQRVSSRYQNAEQIHYSASLRQHNAIRTSLASRQSWQNAIRIQGRAQWDVHNAIRTATRSYHPWQEAMGLIHGQFYYHPPSFSWHITLKCDGYPYFARNLDCQTLLGYGYPDQPDCPICYRPTWGHLGQTASFQGRPAYSQLLDEDAGAARWQCNQSPDPEPTHTEAIFVSNSFSLIRASDSAPIEVRDFQAQIDAESWCWSWSATIPATAMALITPQDGDPVEVIATLNSHEFRFLIESIQRERRFPQRWVTISGRSISAWLAEPYSEVRTYDNEYSRTANQLAEEALSINGVPIGWDVVWNLTDWSIPAGEWNYQGTPIEAVIKVAEAAGGYVQAHDNDKILSIRPYYPKLPRDWDQLTADHELDEGIMEVETLELISKAPYNAVWCVGAAQGRKDKVRLAGTAGDNPAPMIYDPLLTHTDATRQRGIRVLGDTGRQTLISLRLPILPETGIIKPGHILDYASQGSTKRGITRSTSIDYQNPQAWQTIGVETHG
jgi:hypothetical protein